MSKLKRKVRKSLPRSKSRKIKTGASASEVHVGFDFGTSQSKAVVYWEFVRRREVVAWPGAPMGSLAFLLPSVVGRDGDALVFGFAADRLDTSVSARSFKVCIACEQGMACCRRCAAVGSTPGHLAVGGDGRAVFTASELSTLYIAYALGQVDEWIARHPTIASGTDRTLNSAAPLDRLQHHGLQSTFELVVQRAIHLRGRVKDGLPVAQARELLIEAAENVPTPRTPEEALAFVVPEACAATLTVIRGPGAVRRRYAILDVGAGSTDVGVFWCYEGNIGEPVWDFYSSTSAFVAGDAMDGALLEYLAQTHGVARSGESLRALRNAKPDGDHQGLEASGCRITWGEYERALAPVTKGIFSTYQKTWGRARAQFAPRAEHWPDLDILLAGGGSRCWPLRARIQNDFPMSGFCESRHVRRVALPTDLSWDLTIPEEIRERSADLLAVAVGLSYPHLDLPKYEQETNSLPQPPNEPEIIVNIANDPG